jgi:hypothetical protein
MQDDKIAHRFAAYKAAREYLIHTRHNYSLHDVAWIDYIDNDNPKLPTKFKTRTKEPRKESLATIPTEKTRLTKL